VVHLQAAEVAEAARAEASAEAPSVAPAAGPRRDLAVPALELRLPPPQKAALAQLQPRPARPGTSEA